MPSGEFTGRGAGTDLVNARFSGAAVAEPPGGGTLLLHREAGIQKLKPPKKKYEAPDIDTTSDAPLSPFEAVGERSAQVFGGSQKAVKTFLTSVVRTEQENAKHTWVVDMTRPRISDDIVDMADGEGYARVDVTLSASSLLSDLQMNVDNMLYTRYDPSMTRERQRQVPTEVRENLLFDNRAAWNAQKIAANEAAETFAQSMPSVSDDIVSAPEDKISTIKTTTAHIFTLLAEVSLPKLQQAVSELQNPTDEVTQGFLDKARQEEMKTAASEGRQPDPELANRMTPAQRDRIRKFFGTERRYRVSESDLTAIANHAQELLSSDQEDRPYETFGTRPDAGVLTTHMISNDRLGRISRARLLAANVLKQMSEQRKETHGVPNNLILIGAEDIPHHTLDEIRNQCEGRRTRLIEVYRRVETDPRREPKVRSHIQTMIILTLQGAEAGALAHAIGEHDPYLNTGQREEDFDLRREFGRLEGDQFMVITRSGRIDWGPTSPEPKAVDYVGPDKQRIPREKKEKGNKDETQRSRLRLSIRRNRLPETDDDLPAPLTIGDIAPGAVGEDGTQDQVTQEDGYSGLTASGLLYGRDAQRIRGGQTDKRYLVGREGNRPGPDEPITGQVVEEPGGRGGGNDDQDFLIGRQGGD